MLNFGKKMIISLSVITAIALSSSANSQTTNEKQELSKAKSVLDAYTNVALASYSETLDNAKALKIAIDKFAKNPTQETLNNAKLAWLVSRESYGQTEALRLSKGPIDAQDGWVSETYGALEGQINAWPLDENMIDYTIDENGKKTSGNIIDTIGKFNPGGEESKEVDVTKITAEAITELNENGGEANVATGYHAIEFLLWGQDQDYSNFLKDKVTKGAMTAGQRSQKDFTSDKNASRRLAYLSSSAEKIVADLEVITSAWEKNVDGNRGLYQAALLGKLTGDDASKNIDSNEALKQIIAGLGVFIKS